MAELSLLGALALVLSLVLTPSCGWIFRVLGFVDIPDNHRKIHTGPIPRAGGTAIALSYVAAFLIFHAIHGGYDQRLVLVRTVLPAAVTMFVVGVVDDLVGLKPWQKLAGQLVACAIACFSGITIRDLVGVHEQAWWTYPLTVLWLVASTNAFNLVDGLDGLAGGVGLFATLTMFIAALLQRNSALAFATVPLVGCLLGFLRYNFAPATVFLGDSGALTIGFVLGCYGVIWTQKSATLLGMTAPVMALSVPLIDVGLAIVRRFIRRQPIFGADRGHIHHRLLERGMTPRQVATIFYAVCSVVAVFSLLYSQSHSNRTASVIVLLFCGVAWTGIQYLGYAEFAFAGKMLFGGDLQRVLSLQLKLHAFETALNAIDSAGGCVTLVGDAAAEFGLRMRTVQVCGETAIETGLGGSEAWSVTIRFEGGDFIEFERDPVVEGSAGAGLFLDCLRDRLPAKLGQFRRNTGAVTASEATVW